MQRRPVYKAGLLFAVDKNHVYAAHGDRATVVNGRSGAAVGSVVETPGGTHGEAIKNRVDVCNQAGAVCRIVMTLKALRMEARGVEPDDAIAGSAVRRYSEQFAATHRAAGAGSAAPAASDSFIDDPCWTDPADE
jgi:hypothetical protein